MIRDADDFVRCLAIEFEIEFGLGSIIVPVAKALQVTATEAPLGASHDADELVTCCTQ